MGNKPYKKIRIGSISITIWKNMNKIDGNEITNYSTQVDRNYQDKDKEWQTTNSFRINDIPKVILGLQEAYKELTLNLQLNKEQDQKIVEEIVKESNEDE